MENIYLFNYNNYANRIFKKNVPAAISGYPTALDSFGPLAFNPNDGISAEQIVNYHGTTPDYLVVTDSTTDAIISRWFVMEAIRTRSQQYRMLLKRDVLADFKDSYVTSTGYIKRGIISSPDINNPYFYQDEGLSFNQVLRNRMFLYDKTGKSWLVAYLDSKQNSNIVQIIDKTVSNKLRLVSTFDYATIEPLINRRVLLKPIEEFVIMYFNWKNAGSSTYGLIGYMNDSSEEAEMYNNRIEDVISLGDTLGDWVCSHPSALATDIPISVKNKLKYLRENGFVDAMYGKMGSTENNLVLKEEDYLRYDNAIIFNPNDNRYYRIHINMDSNRTTKHFYFPYISQTNTYLENLGYTYIKDANIYDVFDTEMKRDDYSPYISNTSAWGLDDAILVGDISVIGARITLEAIPQNFRLHVTGSTFSSLHSCQDNPFAMMVLEYSLDNLNYMIDLAKNLGSYCYDVQVLPYFPMQDCINNDGTIDLQKIGGAVSPYGEGTEYIKIGDAENYDPSNPPAANTFTNISYLFLCKESIFNVNLFNIVAQIGTDTTSINYFNTSGIQQYTNSWSIKRSYLTRKLRLCAPDQSSMFDFSKEMNDGISNQYIANCTYKPYNPYIKIAPLFGGFYGYSMNSQENSGSADYRGIVFKGDYSIPIIRDEWRTYEINNKNYELIFNREVQSLETQQSVSRAREDWNITKAGVNAAMTAVQGVAGVIGGAVMGGAAGAGAAGLAAVGGLVKSGMSIADAYQTKEWNETLRKDALSFKGDMHEFQLGNIKALPSTITKTGCLNNDNPRIPYVEIYFASSDEVSNLQNIIRYRGMKIGKFDTINTFLNADRLPNTAFVYLEADLVMVPNLNDDTHVYNEIASELSKGVFVYE